MKFIGSKYGIDYIEIRNAPVIIFDLSHSNKSTSPAMDDSKAWENFFHELPTEQLEYFVCKYLGIKNKEAIKVLQLKSGSKYGNIRTKILKFYKDSKWLTK